jgi:hypothetical protein
MEEHTIIETIFITIWFFWTGTAFHYHSRYRNYLKMYSDKIEMMTQITNKWATHQDNEMKDLEDYERIKSQLQLWSLEESEHRIKKEDVITFLWYAAAFLLGGAGLYRLIWKIWE